MYTGARTSHMLDSIREEVARRHAANPVCALSTCGQTIDKPEHAALAKGGGIVHVEKCYVRHVVETHGGILPTSRDAAGELVAK
jgi:hypothetical protein